MGRQKSAGLGSSQAGGWQRKQQAPIEVFPTGGCNYATFSCRRDSHPSQKTGCHVVRVALPPAGLFENLFRRQAQVAEVIRQKDARQKSGGARATPHPQRNLVIEFHVKTRREDAGVCKNIHVCSEDEVLFKDGAEVGVATCSVY